VGSIPWFTQVFCSRGLHFIKTKLDARSRYVLVCKLAFAVFFTLKNWRFSAVDLAKCAGISEAAKKKKNIGHGVRAFSRQHWSDRFCDWYAGILHENEFTFSRVWFTSYPVGHTSTLFQYSAHGHVSHINFTENSAVFMRNWLELASIGAYRIEV